MQACGLRRSQRWLIHIGCLLIVTGFHHRATAGVVRRVEGTETKTFALIVGIDEYSDVGKGLQFAVSDARSMQRALTNPETGIVSQSDTVLLLNSHATKSAILGALDAFRKRLKPKDTLIFYWGGHTTYDEKTSEVYLFPSDVKREDLRSTAIGLTRDLIPAGAAQQSDLVFIADGCHVGDGLIARISSQFRNVGVLSASMQDELAYEDAKIGGGLMTHFALEAMNSSAADLDGDGYVSLLEIYSYLLPRVIQRSSQVGFAQHPALAGGVTQRMQLAKVQRQEVTLELPDSLPNDFLAANELTINGKTIHAQLEAIGSNQVRVLGDLSGLIGQGLNYVSTKQQDLLVWEEGNKLRKYESPYNNSYAIIAAINDYSRKKDVLKRGTTGFSDPPRMVENAESLRTTLESLGFARDHILTFYDEKATSKVLSETLQRFWLGGDLEKADRVFFYFGGHGNSTGQVGYLVTYDFDRKQPTRTSLLMKDLTGRQSENMTANHVFFAIDACHSGLAVRKSLGDNDTEAKEKELKEFRSLTVIRNDTQFPARDILVAGVDRQDAVYDDHGGIFTQALISGLQGKADLNNDGIIQFGELTLFVKNEVALRATLQHAIQTSEGYQLQDYGKGSVVFLKQRTQAAVLRPPR